MNTRDPLHYLTLAEAGDLIRTRSISPLELVNAQLERIRQFDPSLKAYVQVTADSAREQARAAEAEIHAGTYRGPLHGVPVAVKDLFCTKGVLTQGGLRQRLGHIPGQDASAVRLLKEAGAILLGKLHTSEGAMDGYHRDFPIPRNPWEADRWPGISSSGSGVAVSAGLCYAALGTDTGGSIRIPAAANGIVGLKPTQGLVSTEGVLPLSPSLDHVGPMTRSVGDAAILLRALSTVNEPVPEIHGLRIGVDERLNNDGVMPYVAEAVWQAAEVMRNLGAQVLPVSLPEFDDASEIWYTIASYEAALTHHGEYGEAFQAFLERGRAVSASEYGAALLRRVEGAARIAACFQGFDVLACPTLPDAAFRYDPADGYGRSGGIPPGFLAAMDRLMTPFNLNGYPALALPCGVSPDGMPLSMQMVGPAHAEPLLLGCGIAFEQETAWHLQHPPVYTSTSKRSRFEYGS